VERIVHFEQVGVSLGGSRVLVDLDLTLDPGQRLGVVGPNGSGKTTLVRTAATLVAIDAGRATVLGSQPDRTRDLTSVRARIGLITHEPALVPELTLSENLEHIARLAGIDTDRIPRALNVVGLSAAASRRADASSFGMKRRIEIAHLLLSRPALLLLDEAASGLDESARDLIEALLATVCDGGGAALVVSHDRTHLEQLCDEVLTLRSGRLERSA
jgi:heme exporter protein A